jgi:hypothetical protein
MKLEMAEAMAYNRQCLGMIGGILSVQKLPEGARKYVQFYHRNFRLFRQVESAAEVAILHSFSSLAFNNDRPYQSTWLFEQALIQAKVPYDIIFDQHLKDISKYRVLVLADQECLSNEQLHLIREYVKNGGGLVASEWSSLYTEWRELRPSFGLEDLFQFKAPVFSDEGTGVSSAAGEKLSPAGPRRNQAGRGRVVYIPEVKAAVEKPSAVPMTSRYWNLPLNWQDLIEAVLWAADGELGLEVKAPLTVTGNLLRQKETAAMLLHLINYAVGRDPLVKDIQVRLNLSNTEKVSRVSLLSPDREEVLSLPFTTNKGHIVFAVPSLQTYNIVEVA